MVALARVDNELHEREASVIRVIGRANGFSESEVETLLASVGEDEVSESWTPLERFVHLFYLVYLMKADGRVLTSEFAFCQRIATRLGYDPAVIGELATRSAEVDGEVPASLMEAMSHFLKS